MAWPLFYRDTPNTIKLVYIPMRHQDGMSDLLTFDRAWGYKFELTDQHMTPEQYEPLKHTYDVLGEQALNRLDEISPPPTNSHIPRNQPKTPERESSPLLDQAPKRDLYALLRDHADSDEILGQLWREVNTVPSWVDWTQIARGQDVLYRYGAPVLTGLAYQSLLGGMGAARVVETLARTGGFSTSVARHRLFETTQHVLQCTKSLESIQPGGDGWTSTIRVRLLHAAVRNRILKLAETRPEYYDKEKLGVPISDIDSIGTIAGFSSALIYISLPRQGIYIRQQEIEDYIALWRYVAYLIGCPTTGFFETAEQSKRVLECIFMYEIQPTRTSQILANNVIKSLADKPPAYASADYLVAGARWLNSNELCDALALPRPSMYYWALTVGQCIFFAFWCYTNRMFECWDKPKIQTLRQLFWNIVVKGGLKGEESSFDFKYVPEYSIITEMGGDDQVKMKRPAMEMQSLKWLLMTVGVVAVVSWMGVKISLFGLHLAIGGLRSGWSWIRA